MTYYPDDHPAFDMPEFNPEPIEEEFPVEPDREVIDGVVYDIHDPKGPKYHSTHADIWDQREGK